ARRSSRVAREPERGEEREREQAFHPCKNSIRVGTPGLSGARRSCTVCPGFKTIRLIAAMLLALAAPAAASAGLVSMRVQDVPLGHGRTLQAAEPAGRFDMVGVHWMGPGSVDYRTQSADGSWRAWR